MALPRFNPASLEPDESFLLLGLVLGLAVYNRVLCAFPAPLLLYEKLLQQVRGGPRMGRRGCTTAGCRGRGAPPSAWHAPSRLCVQQ